MINKEWEDFFGIEEASDTSYIETDFNIKQKDAVAVLASCVNANGCVDLNWMCEASGLSMDELIHSLHGAIYQDPEVYDLCHADDQGWMLRAQYLSGHIKFKLETAKRLNHKYNDRFAANVAALKAIMPPKSDFDAIGFSIGSPWIPNEYYEAFAKDILGLARAPKISHSAALGRYHVKIASKYQDTVPNLFTYGTLHFSGLLLIEYALNGITPKPYDDVVRLDRKSGIARVLNKTESLAAQEKINLLQKAFSDWIRKNSFRVKELKKIYYNTYACNVPGRYSGCFLDLPGLNTEHFTPYPHQKDAVARIILDKDVLLNHKVGTGKTNIIIMGIHERKRIGLSEKNLIVVPNNVLEAFESAHRQLYPQDHILVIHPEDFKPAYRQNILTKIRDENYVAVYLPFSSFGAISMSRQYKLDRQSKLIQSYRAKATNAPEQWERARLETIVKRQSKKLAEMMTDLPYDEYLCFDELGITTLVVDEAHNFKNISLNSHTDGVVGMHIKGSKKCDEMYEKVQFVRNHDGGVIFSTGTPLTNSIADLFVMQSFLQPEQLALLHLNHFDEWISNFATRQTSFEVDVDSQNYRMRTRFSSFHNIPELISLVANICDFYNDDEGQMDLPESETYTDIIVPKSPEQDAYIKSLADRTEKIRQKLVRNAATDNLLKITHDGRAAALDIRLADSESHPDTESTKTYACAQNVYRLFQLYPNTAQLVFCDLGTPKKGFNIYDELKRLLVEMGIPKSEIAFVHDAGTDAKRRKLFEAVNRASVRVLIGSTSKLGTGVNVQKRLIGIHHLDIPWKPSDIMQREGRLIRQGNENSTVFRFRYITAGTFDAYSWQLLENKQRFISQFMNHTLACRDARDIDDAVLTYAEIKALSVGDPLLKTRIDTSNELERVKIHSRQREQELKKMDTVIAETPQILEKLKDQKTHLALDLAHALANRESLTKEERNAFGEDVLEALTENSFLETDRKFDTLHGCSILLPAGMNPERPFLLIEGVSGNRYKVDMRDAKTGGCIQRIEYALFHLNESIERIETKIKNAIEQRTNAKAEVRKGNPYASDVLRLTEKLLDIDEQLNLRTNGEESA